VGGDPFETWRQRREAEGAKVTLIDLYRLVAEPRGLQPQELPLAERVSLRDRALPVMWPGYEVPPGSERAEHDPVEIVTYDPAWPSRFQTWRARIDAVLGSAAERVEHVGSTAIPGLAAKLAAAQRWRDDRVAYADAKTEVILRLRQDAEGWARDVGWRARPS